MPDEESITEAAKAIQEVAKATGKAIDASQNIGGFISRLISGSLEQGMGIFEDKLKYMRWERQLRLKQRSEQMMVQLGMNEPTRAISMKLALPLLQAASVEDDDFLQDMWARLLVNGINKNSGVDLKRVYIDILENLTPLEVTILEKIYSVPYSESQHHGVITQYLPLQVSTYKEEVIDSYQEGTITELDEPKDEIKFALANLDRLGCISLQRSLGGGELYSVVHPTVIGKNFVQACTLVLPN